MTGAIHVTVTLVNIFLKEPTLNTLIKMKRFYLALVVLSLGSVLYFLRFPSDPKTEVSELQRESADLSPSLAHSSHHDSGEASTTASNKDQKRTDDSSLKPPSPTADGNLTAASRSPLSNEFFLTELPGRPNLAHSPIFGFKTALNIPENVRDFSKTFALKIQLDEPSPIREISGSVSLLFRSLHELNSDIFLAVADVAIFDPDAKTWRRMTGKESKDFSLSNPFEFEINLKDGTFRGDIHESVLPMRIRQLYWPQVPLIDLRRLSCRGFLQKNVERAEFTGKIKGEVFSKVRTSEGEPYTDQKVGTCVLIRHRQ
jgi:hypothetical protein